MRCAITNQGKCGKKPRSKKGSFISASYKGQNQLPYQYIILIHIESAFLLSNVPFEGA